MIRRVDRPDVLMVAALLHDIGKGSLTEHSVAGEPIAREIATRMGFDAEGVELIAQLVRWHLLLAETATTRDPDDPATVQAVAERVAHTAGAGPAHRAHRGGRPGGVAQGVVDVAGGADPRPVPAYRRRAEHRCAPCRGRLRRRSRSRQRRRPAARRSPSRTSTTAAGSLRSPRTGSACSPTSRRCSRCSGSGSAAARAWYQDGFGVSVWEVAEEQLQPATLRQTYDGIVEGRLDPASRLRPSSPSPLPPSVEVRPEASAHATVLEVRTTDRPGCRAPGVRRARRAGRDRPLGARRHAGPAGGRRVLPPGVLGRGAQRPAGGGCGARGQGCAGGRPPDRRRASGRCRSSIGGSSSSGDGTTSPWFCRCLR